MSASSSVVFHLYLFPQQDNVWKYALNSRANQEAIRAFDMVFIIGQRSYEGYEYYDFFDQVFERLKKHPFWSNLTSETEVRRNEPFILLKKKKRKISDTLILFLSSVVRSVLTLLICTMQCFFMQWD